jgi:hypothetical protein
VFLAFVPLFVFVITNATCLKSVFTEPRVPEETTFNNFPVVLLAFVVEDIFNTSPATIEFPVIEAIVPVLLDVKLKVPPVIEPVPTVKEVPVIEVPLIAPVEASEATDVAPKAAAPNVPENIPSSTVFVVLGIYTNVLSVNLCPKKPFLAV